MTTPKRYDTLRLRLIRLYQAMGRDAELAGDIFGDPGHAPSGSETPDPSTYRVLPTIEGSRRHIRIKDRLPVIYSESPEIAEQVARGASRTKRTMDFATWLQEVARHREQRVNPVQGMDLRIHLQAFEEEMIYFLAFWKRDPDRKGPVPLREIETSGAGMSFPTEIAHPRGEKILIVYFLPTDPFPPLQLVAEVVRPSRRLSKGGYGTPVRYVDISQAEYGRIMEYMASRQRQKSLAKAYEIGPP